MTKSSRPSPHERLRAYQLAQELTCEARTLAGSLPAGHADLRDQIRRSSHAVVRHIAEGANRWTPADKIARFTIAAGELGECEACMDTLRRLELVSEEAYEACSEVSRERGRVLSGLIRYQRGRAG